MIEATDARAVDHDGGFAVSVARQFQSWFSAGSSLPYNVWAQRHRWILALLWVHVPGIFVFALVRGNSVDHSAVEASIVMAFAAAATFTTMVPSRRRLSTVLTSTGLMAASAVLVHLAGGAIEMHFHYFVMVGVVTLYQDWVPFLVAIGFVVVQHGTMGVVDPHSVYAHHAGQTNPWRWAAIHGGFILAMSATGIASWRLNELLQRRALEREVMLAEAQEVARLGSWELHVRTGQMEWSDELFRLLGLPADTTPTLEALLARVHPESRAAIDEAVAGVRDGIPFSGDFRIEADGTDVQWVHGRVRATAEDAEGVTVVSGTAQDVTDRKLAESELSETLSLLTATLDSTADGILVVDLDGHITSFNERFVELWHIPTAVLESRDDRDALGFVLSQLADPDAFVAKVEALYAQPDALSEDTIEFLDGRTFERMSMPQRVQGATVGRVWSFRDITERKRLENELSHQAFHDSLTGLANKALFRDRCEHALSRIARGPAELAVLFIDLDDFKTVNDSLGHTAGDELLVAVADRVRASLRTSDSAARLGGDEFAVLLEDLPDEDEAEQVAQRVLSALDEPFAIYGHDVVLGASIGIAFAPGTTTCDQLLRNADLAMYTAKRHGKHRFESYRAEMHAVALDRLERESALRRGLDRGELVLHYQPVVSLPLARIVGFEALVRWQHPEQGLLQPSEFIALAEETGLVGELGRQVLAMACEQTRAWQLRHPDFEPISVSVNVSPRQLQCDDFVDQVETCLRESRLPAVSLVLEITETAMMRDTDATIAKLELLRGLGVRLAVDDFGTGYSSLSYLQRFPVDILKIDRSFVSTIGSQSIDVSLAPAILSLANTLHLNAVAEGVETELQAEILAALGCPLAQGFLFSRPVTAEAAGELLTRPSLGALKTTARSNGSTAVATPAEAG